VGCVKVTPGAEARVTRPKAADTRMTIGGEDCEDKALSVTAGSEASGSWREALMGTAVPSSSTRSASEEDTLILGRSLTGRTSTGRVRVVVRAAAASPAARSDADAAPGSARWASAPGWEPLTAAKAAAPSLPRSLTVRTTVARPCQSCRGLNTAPDTASERACGVPRTTRRREP
jgi:hypothetical protein